MTTARATVSVKAPENDLNYIWNWDSLKYVCGYYEITLEWSAPNWICKSILSRTTRTLRQGARVRPVRLPPSKHWIRSTRQANVPIKLIQLTPHPAVSYCFMFFTLFISESVGQTNALKITQRRGRRVAGGWSPPIFMGNYLCHRHVSLWLWLQTANDYPVILWINIKFQL